MESTLMLTVHKKNGITQIKDLYFTSPYKIMSPFMEAGKMEVMQMCASAGLLGGDSFLMELLVEEESNLTYTTQSYEKVFCTKGEPTTKYTKIKVEKGASLFYLPYPVIPHAGSDFYGENTIFVDEDATLLFGDIVTCGRKGMGECFQMKRFESKTKIFVGEKLAFADHTLHFPEEFSYSSMGMWENYTHNGILYIYAKENEEQLIEKLRQESAEAGLTGVSRCENGVLVRTLSDSGDKIYKMFQKIAGVLSK